MQHAWVALHIACHVQFTVTSIGHAIYYNRFSTLWKSAYGRDEHKGNRFIATTVWKLVKDFGLFNMITKPTLYSIHNFDHYWSKRANCHFLLVPNYFILVCCSCNRRGWNNLLGLQVLKNLCRNQSKRNVSQYSSIKNSFSIDSTRKWIKVLGQSDVQNKSKTPWSRVTKWLNSTFY